MLVEEQSKREKQHNLVYKCLKKHLDGVDPRDPIIFSILADLIMGIHDILKEE